MPITSIQQGLITENEILKLAMMGSGGAVEGANPVTDDDGRDKEFHRRGQYGFALANQIKSTTRLHLSASGMRYLVCRFDIRPERIVNSPYFWYSIGYLDPKLMRFADPLFFVPSTVLHKHARQGRAGKVQGFLFKANMEPESRDLWVPHRVNTADFGKRVLEVMDDLQEQQKRSKELLLSLPPADPDVLWLRRAA